MGTFPAVNAEHLPISVLVPTRLTDLGLGNPPYFTNNHSRFLDRVPMLRHVVGVAADTATDRQRDCWLTKGNEHENVDRKPCAR